MVNIVVNDLVENIRLALINEQNILPIIGFDLIPVKADDGSLVPYLDYLSMTIAKDKQITLNQGLSGFELFNLATHQLLILNQFDKLETTKQVSTYAKSIHDKVDTSHLKKIVTIFPFKYFLNLTFTTHLSEVMQEDRSFPKIAVNESSFPFQLKNPKKPEDVIKNNCGFLASVYNLYGLAYYKGNVRFNYYYSDDDMLDFISEFNKRFEVDLKNYKEIIKDSSLLFLGCQYPDWLLRVLINTLKPGSLDANNRLQARVFIDYCNDNSTIFFLTKHRLQFQKALQTRPFIQNLNEVLSGNRFALNPEKSSDYIFISYTRDNLDVVQKIVCQLAVQANIWFDRIKLFPGDLINDDVKKAIQSCKFFIPILTNESIGKQPADYVRQEWIYYRTQFASQPKVIPLVHKTVNLGTLGFNTANEFANPGVNLFHVLFDDNGLAEEDIIALKNRM